MHGLKENSWAVEQCHTIQLCELVNLCCLSVCTLSVWLALDRSMALASELHIDCRDYTAGVQATGGTVTPDHAEVGAI